MRPKTFCSICERPTHAYGLCDTHYREQKRAGVVFSQPAVAERFWSKVQKTDKCWIWMANRNRRGYGKFCLNKRQEPAHRVAYMLTYGEIPAGLWVLHHCDNPSCVRPDHLYVGTHADNVRDRVVRGRSARGERNGARLYPERILRGDNHPFNKNPHLRARGDRSAARQHPERYRGEQNGNAKIDRATVERIRTEYAAGGTSTLKLAAKYGLGKSQMYNIVSKKSWQ